MENYAQKSNIRRFNESSYDIMEVINKKRLLHSSAPGGSNNPFPNSTASTLNKASSSNSSNSSSTVPFSFKAQNSKIIASSSKLQPNQNIQNNLNAKQMKSADKKKQEILQENYTPVARQGFLHSILKWNTVWLKNQDANYTDKLCKEKLQRLKLEYESINEYIEIYKPLILNEIFAQICEKVETIKRSNHSFTKLFVHSYESADDFLVLNCVLPIKNEDLRNCIYPNEGDLLVVEISVNDKTELNLGYLSEFAMDDITEKTILNELIGIKNCSKLLRFIIKMRLKNLQINVGKHIRCSPIFYLKPVLRQCDALENLDQSALANGIIKPNKGLMKIKMDYNLTSDNKYNSSQLNVIHNATNLVNSKQPGILLVQGPPGAGKTHTLIGMVKKIFLEWKDLNSSPKILICAPSNGAIDEIGKRLFREREFLKKSNANRDLRIIRIGQEDKMSDYVKKTIYINSLVEKNIRSTQEDKSNLNETELEQRENELRKLEMEENRLDREKLFDELRHVKQKINVIRKQINYLESCQMKLMADKKKSNLNIEGQKKKLHNDLLFKADIVLTTLSSCCSSSLLQIFNSSRIFNCCIIDEASQCTEPEILMPLSFSSINKMILIGDPMQLPGNY